MWKLIRETTSTKRGIQKPVINIEIANEYFGKIAQKSSTLELQHMTGCDTINAFQIDLLTPDQVLSKLREVNQTTAGGFDEITANIIKLTAESITPNLTKIMNTSIQDCVVPSMWKKANVKIIWKGKGKKRIHQIIDQYRYYQYWPESMKS